MSTCRQGDVPAYQEGSSELAACIKRGFQEHEQEHCFV
jgi:hypothetical protein